MLGWSPKDISTVGTSTLSANMSAVQVGNTFPLTSSGATNALVIAINCSSIAGTVTFQLQTAIAGSFTNVTGKTATGTNGWAYIKLHHNVSGDAALMPLLDVARIIVTTDGSGAGTINSLYVLQEQ